MPKSRGADRGARRARWARHAVTLVVALGGGCSLENIGTGTTRVVSGKIVSEGAP